MHPSNAEKHWTSSINEKRYFFNENGQIVHQNAVFGFVECAGIRGNEPQNVVASLWKFNAGIEVVGRVKSDRAGTRNFFPLWIKIVVNFIFHARRGTQIGGIFNARNIIAGVNKITQSCRIVGPRRPTSCRKIPPIKGVNARWRVGIKKSVGSLRVAFIKIMGDNFLINLRAVLDLN